MAENNKMVDVARLFGVEFEKKFRINYRGGRLTVGITPYGLVEYRGQRLELNNDLFIELLRGVAVIVDE
jgi:hypothetical protein